MDFNNDVGCVLRALREALSNFTKVYASPFHAAAGRLATRA